MKVVTKADILFCPDCEPVSEILLRRGMVGSHSWFPTACPHVEAKFIEWHHILRDKEPPKIVHVLIPLLCGLGIGFGIGSVVFG